MDLIDKIMAFENDEMGDVSEVIEFFQELKDTGMINSLQGYYQRAMANLIEAGLVH